MSAPTPGRRPALTLAFLVFVVGGGAQAPPAAAFEFFDGRLQVHGFFEEQIRAIGRDFSTADDIDLTQWYHVLNVEIEYEAVDDGWGPIDLLSFFARVEARYDCVWSRACGIFPSVNTFGSRPERLPGRMNDGTRSGFQGSLFIADLGKYSGRIVTPIDGGLRAGQAPRDPSLPMEFAQLHRIDGLHEVAGPDQIFAAGRGPDGADDPAFFYFNEISANCLFASREVAGGDDGHGVQIMGPINTGCDVDPFGRLRGQPNPFNSMDEIPVLFGPDRDPAFSPGDPTPSPVGSGELPGRAASEYALGALAPPNASQGVYYPSPAYRRLLTSGGDFDNPDQNFRQEELEWNHGASQQDEKELKELYADLELFESRLWLRLGKQNIVWGKTELFRTTDQFNPQDLALATLPALEESRIPLWAIRGVWSFWESGPVEDLRLELAVNFDQFEPDDLGRCGEPFTVFAACAKTTGLFFHGVTGFGLAGESRPPNPWNSLHGVEIGGRVEFRLGRVSMSLSNFYGFDDRPYAKRIFDYGRRVDPATGRPLRAFASGGCATGLEAACLPVADGSGRTNILPDGSVPAGTDLVPDDPAAKTELLASYATNIQLFAMICATSIGFNELVSPACAQSVFNAPFNALLLPGLQEVPRSQSKSAATVASLLSNVLAGNPNAGQIVTNFFTDGATVPLVRLRADPCDDELSGCTGTLGRTSNAVWGGGGTPTLNTVLTDEQEALLGCGPFWGTDCEEDGIDLLNAEASVLMQSVVGFDGVYADPATYNLIDGGPRPGTLAFVGADAATRYAPGLDPNDPVVTLPGARGPDDPLYDPDQDGCVFDTGAHAQCAGMTALAFPAATYGAVAGPGDVFRSEMAALSYNFQNLLVAFSTPPDAASDVAHEEFDSNRPFSTAPGQCSFAQPQFCGVLNSIYLVLGVQRNHVRAGSRGRFGRRDFVWQSGGEAVLHYQKRNVLGFSMDFAEDVTKSNWSIETAWIEGERFTNVDEEDGISEADTFNVTISVDRPTFINFLNEGRTFFINSQWFFQYVSGYDKGFTTNGPWNILATLTVQTGYFDDRLNPAVTFVYDKRSNSGAALPQISYRFTSNFSATIGVNFFWGRFETRPIPLRPIASVDNQVGKRAYQEGVENALSVVRDRDEAYLRIRYTF